MLRPAAAPVKPRVISPDTGDSIALDDAVRDLLSSHARGAVEIVGAKGAGKTTALEHLAATLDSPPRLVLLDEPDAAEVQSRAADALVVFTSHHRRAALTDRSFPLVPWTDDDAIEYLLAVHPAECRSVMERLSGDPFRCHVGGEPHLWRIVLDEMAFDRDVPDVRSALGAHLRRSLNVDQQQLARQYCLVAITNQPNVAHGWFRKLREANCDAETLDLLRHEAIRLLLAAERVREHVRAMPSGGLPRTNLPQQLVVETGRLVRGDRTAIRRLRKLLKHKVSELHSLAASLLHAAEAAWKPRKKGYYAGAYLAGVKWPGRNLRGANLSEAQLFAADLAKANLCEANLNDAVLRRASLHQARLTAARLRSADLQRADLSQVQGELADLSQADLKGADLERADLRHANLCLAELTGCRCWLADLSDAALTGARIEDADFTNVNFLAANLRELPLRTARIDGACFASAVLQQCDLEFVELDNADFEEADLSHAWLTGSVMPAANFQRASLRGAGLADVEWEGADLREADLRGSMFHMGSSRSGLVDSPYPSHGTRTGFYTDFYDESHYKSPEEIRKANLCGADLRGAQIRDVDFYLVDLRGAKYDPEQAAHFRLCDAILDEP